MAKKKPSKTKVHLVTYTHWDREFRWEFERTRMRLVDALDKLLDIMEAQPEYASFMLDGQFTLVEDYLEIRPENRERMQKLATEGRLETGPWYTLPDCAPIHGESIIRNLKYGYRKAQAFGGLMKVGYDIFSFGQVSQLPQLYQSFGIETIIFYKYMDPSRTKHHEFWWEGPDGSRTLASRLGREARWNFFFAAHIPIMYARDPWHKSWQYRWNDELGKIFHTASPGMHGWFYEVLDPRKEIHDDKIEEGMERALDTVKGTAFPESVLMFDGTDFTEPHPLTTEYIKKIQERYGDELEFVHSRLGDYINELHEALKERKDLEVLRGPMRDGPVGSVHSDVMSVHTEITRLNSAAENEVLRYVEPLSTIACALGIEAYPTSYLEKIWRLLFQSQVHDSLHGLGPVTLVEGEIARLKQAKVIADGLERRALQNLTKEIDTSKIKDGEVFVAVHNPSSFERSEVVEAYFDVPADVALDHLVMTDLEGNKVLIQEVEREQTRAGLYHPLSRNMPFYCTKVRCFFEAKKIPALGYKTFKLDWAEKKEYPYPHEDWDAPRILADDMLAGPASAENEHLRVNVNPDGTFTILVKKTGHAYHNLNYFLDAGETGNMWMSDTPGEPGVVRSLGQPAKVRVRLHGPLAVIFEVESQMELPVEFDRAKKRRSTETVSMPVKVTATLRKGCPYLEVVTEIENRARDHYLKVCFPTEIPAERTWAEGPYDVADFPVKPSRQDELRGKELARHPSQLWFDLSDGKQGFAVLNDAARDYEVLENDDASTLAMSVIRSVPLRIPCDNRLWMEYPGDESAQGLGKHTLRYALMPHQGLWLEAGLYDASLAFNAPMRVCQLGKQAGRLPQSQSFLALEGENLVLGAVTRSEDRDSILVRFHNPTKEDQQATLKVGLDLKEAHLVNLNEERLEELKVNKGTLKVPAPMGKIVTVELVV